MEIIELMIVIGLLITLSNILSKAFPAIPIFFIQIFFGVLLGMTSLGQSINFEPEIFLVMIIAPLLFREGERANVPAILKNSRIILCLAFGGVIVTLLAVGMTLHWFMPTIPLAACFAFGAALGPTDAVAVSSLAKRLNVPTNVLNILNGEGLLNDASGVTALQFAILALVTGSFSLGNASLILIYSSIGGAIIGYFLVWLKRRINDYIEKISAQDVSVYLLIELLLPFLAYLLAELIGVSGIIAAVVAGISQARGNRRVSLFDAELANISESTWSTIVFTLNALVFLFLGIELSQVFSPVWQSRSYENNHLLVTVIVITMVLFFVRFLFLICYYKILKSLKKLNFQEIYLLTFGGVKGTVSIAAIFILPVTINGLEFQARSLLLFLTACVVLLTLAIGVVVLPFFAEGEAMESIDFNQLLILDEVVQVLEEEEKETSEEKEEWAIQAVVTAYDNRRWEIYKDSMTASQKKEIQEIQGLILSIEQDGLDEAFRKGTIGKNGYRFYSRYLSRQQYSITKEFLSFFGFWLVFLRGILRIFLHPKLFMQRRKQMKPQILNQYTAEVEAVFMKNTEYVLFSLNNLEDVYDSELINFFIRKREMEAKRFTRKNFVAAVMIESEPIFTKKMLRGYYLERKIIDEYEVNEKITTFYANQYRKNVNLLESFAMARVNKK